MSGGPEGKTIEQFFSEVDLDKDNKINSEEYFQAVKRWRDDITDEHEVSQKLLFSLADLDDDGIINLLEFNRLISILNIGFKKDKRSVFITMFKLLDTNDDGKIGKPELVRLMMKLGRKPAEEEINKFIFDYDNDNDGEITLDEFIKAFKL